MSANPGGVAYAAPFSVHSNLEPVSVTSRNFMSITEAT